MPRSSSTEGRTLLTASLSPPPPTSSRTGLFFVVALASGLLLLVGAMLPDPAIRAFPIHNVILVHRIDLALVGGAIVVLVGILRVLAG